MKSIIPHLWFDKEAREAAEFYTSLLPDSKITSITQLHNTPSGDCDIVSFELAGWPFMSISAGPLFKFNPSISFHIKSKTIKEVDRLWEELSKGGTVLMELGEYPFSKRYGWLSDKYGVSWQLIYAGEQEIVQTITPALMFVGPAAGRAEEAINFYTAIFAEKYSQAASKINMVMRYGKGSEPDKEGTIQYASFTLHGQEFVAMDSAFEHKFGFNEAISLTIGCDTQEEIDYFWEKLTEGGDPAAQQCGWLKDKFGVSWQVWPNAIGEMMQKGSQDRIDRLTQAFLPMKKFDIEKLKRAYES